LSVKARLKSVIILTFILIHQNLTPKSASNYNLNLLKLQNITLLTTIRNHTLLTNLGLLQK
jgi:hypothetical protein